MQKKKSVSVSKKSKSFASRPKQKKVKQKKAPIKRKKPKNDSNILGLFHDFSMSFKNRNSPPDKPLLILFIIFVVLGVLAVFDTSSVFASRIFNNPFHFVILQLIWVTLGVGGFMVAYFLDYRLIRRFILVLYLLTLGLLAATLFTSEINGAKSWLSLGGFTLQPSELAKLTFVLYVSGILATKKIYKTTKEFILEDFLPFFLLLMLIVGFVLLGKDLGTSIIIMSVALIMYLFKASTSREYYALMGLLVFCILGGVLMIASLAYRGDRVAVWWHLNQTGEVLQPRDAGYQVKQNLLGFGSGGIWGVGLNQSLQKYDLPETTPATDSVFVIVSEEFGYVGAVALLLGYLLIIYRGLLIANNTADRYGQLVALGIVAWLGMQAFVHVASNVALTPLTGVPIPFLSYGGSSIVSMMIAMGILLNISKQVNVSTSVIKKGRLK